MRMIFLDRSSSSLSYYNFVDVNFPCSNSFLLPEFPSGSLCRSRRELSNDPFIAETGVDPYNVSRKLGCIWQCHGSSTGDPLARSLWWDTAIGMFWSKFQKKKSLIQTAMIEKMRLGCNARRRKRRLCSDELRLSCWFERHTSFKRWIHEHQKFKKSNNVRGIASRSNVYTMFKIFRASVMSLEHSWVFYDSRLNNAQVAEFP